MSLDEIRAHARQWVSDNPPPPLTERQKVVLRRIFDAV